MPLLSVRCILPLCLPEAQPETWWFKSRPVGWKLGHGVRKVQTGRRRHPGTAAPVKRALMPLDGAVQWRLGAVSSVGYSWMWLG